LSEASFSRSSRLGRVGYESSNNSGPGDIITPLKRAFCEILSRFFHFFERSGFLARSRGGQCGVRNHEMHERHENEARTRQGEGRTRGSWPPTVSVAGVGDPGMIPQKQTKKTKRFPSLLPSFPFAGTPRPLSPRRSCSFGGATAHKPATAIGHAPAWQFVAAVGDRGKQGEPPFACLACLAGAPALSSLPEPLFLWFPVRTQEEVGEKPLLN
jgi:hypothetical protein